MATLLCLVAETWVGWGFAAPAATAAGLQRLSAEASQSRLLEDSLHTRPRPECREPNAVDSRRVHIRTRNVQMRTANDQMWPSHFHNRTSRLRTRTAMLAVLLGMCLTAGACGGSDDGDSPPPVSSQPGSTTTASPADPAAEVRAAVTAAQKQYYDAYRAAMANPRDQVLVEALLAVYVDGSVPARNIRGDVAWLAERGYVIRPSADDYYVIEDIHVDAPPPAGRATATVCGYDTGTVIDGVNRAPDGKDIVVNNTPASGRTRLIWVEQGDGTWKIDGGELVDSWEGENRCPPRPAG
ncbi:hypothetical protein I6A84_27490 [Frankia sp. CNm7]|uniref:Uncharacterized protein n=1 Tax=Frankia nepalensis TaxID=1836974 RepID=A0A937RJU7_9ACTN|nr:hypothetical protein [Frankia nepalensis]MBL7498269.1 hypothetical protein [Frankia nepalensis]MBL7509139.1 hypothetical protein [Frankia nepalensis]MBL7521722.1 hypothetical protein [Frankia nepalensis]MBL7630184.1 hypothetical protein [Frankia nepalensis]